MKIIPSPETDTGKKPLLGQKQRKALGEEIPDLPVNSAFSLIKQVPPVHSSSSALHSFSREKPQSRPIPLPPTAC